MPIRRETFETNRFYHAFNRGFQKMPIFKNKFDKARFIEKAHEYSKKLDVSIESSAIMLNHYHFLIQQNEDGGIKEFLSRLQLSYAMYYNKKYERRGPVFDSRYKIKQVDSELYKGNVLNYIFANPVNPVSSPGLPRA